MHLGAGELLVVLVIALMVFGPSKVPQLGDALGKGIRNFKKAMNDAAEDEPAPRAQPALPPASQQVVAAPPQATAAAAPAREG
jgi:sec-independent protein translocase protein TatA